MAEARGFVIAAPRSGSGKTSISLGVSRALAARGVRVAPAKTGPDYIDRALLSQATGGAAINLDPWAMAQNSLTARASRHVLGHDILLIEGVMGLFDGAISGGGSTADLAALLDLPIILVADCTSQAQSIAALVHGFSTFRDDITIAGVILNKVGSDRHEAMLRDALRTTGLACVGAIPARADLALPSRHLGLVLPGDIEGIEDHLDRLAGVIQTHIDLDLLLAMAHPVAPGTSASAGLPPLGQHIAIAHDAAFAFVYPHMLEDWHRAGAQLSFFSPLANEAPPAGADAIFLPGGYPELHGAKIANAGSFKSRMEAARDRGALIYGECGGFMVLGDILTDREGATHAMTGLLPVASRIDKPRRTLGYRKLMHNAALPWPSHLNGHEFHYSSAAPINLPPLFTATDAAGTPLKPMGALLGRVMGSYAHVIAEGGP